MEVTYLRLDPVQPEIGIFDEYMSQQIIYISINQYGADVIIPKTLPMRLHGITLGRNQFWSDNVPDLIVTTMRQCWSNGQPKISVKFDSDNLLTILQFCGTIYLENDWCISNVDNSVLLYKDIHSKVYRLCDTQEYTIDQLETIRDALKDARQIVINTYEDQLIRAFKHKNLKIEFNI